VTAIVRQIIEILHRACGESYYTYWGVLVVFKARELHVYEGSFHLTIVSNPLFLISEADIFSDKENTEQT
jgi:hypothetical protein